MAATRLLMRKLRDILRLKYEAGLGHRAIARACSIGVNTVSVHLQRAMAAGCLSSRRPGGRVSMASLGHPSRAPRAYRLDPHAPQGSASIARRLHRDRWSERAAEVANWIDRLRGAAYRSGNVGSVTPLSNRATICSYPEINKDNDLPGDIGWEALDQPRDELVIAAPDVPLLVGAR